MRPLTRWTTLWRFPVAPIPLVLAFVLVGTGACGSQKTDLAVATERGTFVFRLSFDFDIGSGPGTDVGEVEVTITDRLMSRVEWLNREQVDWRRGRRRLSARLKPSRYPVHD